MLKIPHEKEIEEEQFLMIYGMLALGFMLHHLSENVDIIYFTSIFKNLGAPFAVMFFFVSGYHFLQCYECQIKQRKKINNLIQITSNFLITFLLFQSFLIVQGQQIEFSALLNDFQKGCSHAIFPFSWYAFAYIILRMTSLFVVKFLPQKNSSEIYIIVLLSLIYSYITIIRGLPFSKYLILSYSSYNIGLIWKRVEKVSLKQTNPISTLIYLVLFSINYYLLSLGGLRMICASFSIIILLYFINKFKYNSRLLIFLGHCAIPLFFVQGIVIVMKHYFTFSNDLVFAIISTILILLLSFLFSKLKDLVMPTFIIRKIKPTF